MYYLWLNEAQAGPYTMGQVRSMWHSGQITADTLYWQEGMPGWSSVAGIINLIEEPLPASSERKPLPITEIHRWLLSCTFAIGIIAFFLPNLSLQFPIFGKVNVSMLDLLIPNRSHDLSSSKQDSSDIELKPNAWDFMKENKTDAGGVICDISIFGLMGFYFLTIIWGIYAFALKTVYPVLSIIWLSSALQFPILFSIGANLLISEVRNKINSDLAGNPEGNPFAALGQAMGQAMANNFSIEPGLITWFLMVLAVAGIVFLPLARKFCSP